MCVHAHASTCSHTVALWSLAPLEGAQMNHIQNSYCHVNHDEKVNFFLLDLDLPARVVFAKQMHRINTFVMNYPSYFRE